MATEESKERSGWSTAGILTVTAVAALDAVLGPENNLSGSFGVAPFVTAVGGRPSGGNGLLSPSSPWGPSAAWPLSPIA